MIVKAPPPSLPFTTMAAIGVGVRAGTPAPVPAPDSSFRLLYEQSQHNAETQLQHFHVNTDHGVPTPTDDVIESFVSTVCTI